MNKLIKIKENYYVIDDSEIKEDEHHLHFYNGEVFIGKSYNGGVKVVNISKEYYKITHSTQEGIGIQLNLNDIEELLYGYSIINLKAKFANEELNSDNGLLGNFFSLSTAFEEGFEKHKELSKDKLNLLLGKLHHKYQDKKDYDSVRVLQEIMIALLPPTEWNIEFQNGKIVLV